MAEQKKARSKAREQISFHYTYAPYFRNLYANGVWGGTNPHGEIMMNFFIEKADIPQKTVHTLDQEKLQEVSRTPREDKIIREMQVGIILNLNVARSIREWLDEKIAIMEAAIAKAKEELQ